MFENLLISQLVSAFIVLIAGSLAASAVWSMYCIRYQRRYAEAYQKEFSKILDPIIDETFKDLSDKLQKIYSSAITETTLELNNSAVERENAFKESMAMVRSMLIDAKIATDSEPTLH